MICVQPSLRCGPVRPVRPLWRRRRRAQESAGAAADLGLGEQTVEQGRFIPETVSTSQALDGLARLSGLLAPEVAVSIQRYVQEELGPGLHIEPWRQAIDAYWARAHGDFTGPPPWRFGSVQPGMRCAARVDAP